MTKKRGDGELVQVGELPMMKQLAKKLAPPTKAQQNYKCRVGHSDRPGRRRAGFHGASVGPLHLHTATRRCKPRWLRRTGNSSQSSSQVGRAGGQVFRLSVWQHSRCFFLDYDRGTANEEREMTDLKSARCSLAAASTISCGL